MIVYDPYKSAYSIAERQWKKVVIAIMKKQGITQIDISDVEIVETGGITLIDDKRGFLRIKGEFELVQK